MTKLSYSLHIFINLYFSGHAAKAIIYCAKSIAMNLLWQDKSALTLDFKTQIITFNYERVIKIRSQTAS